MSDTFTTCAGCGAMLRVDSENRVHVVAVLQVSEARAERDRAVAEAALLRELFQRVRHRNSLVSDPAWWQEVFNTLESAPLAEAAVRVLAAAKRFRASLVYPEGKPSEDIIRELRDSHQELIDTVAALLALEQQP